MSAEQVLHKLREAAHPECNRGFYATIAFQRRAQETCKHFCYTRREMRAIADTAHADPAHAGNRANTRLT